MRMRTKFPPVPCEISGFQSAFLLQDDSGSLCLAVNSLNTSHFYASISPPQLQEHIGLKYTANIIISRDSTLLVHKSLNSFKINSCSTSGVSRRSWNAVCSRRNRMKVAPVCLLRTTFPCCIKYHSQLTWVLCFFLFFSMFLPTSLFFSQFLISFYLFVTWSDIIFNHIKNIILIPLQQLHCLICCGTTNLIEDWLGYSNAAIIWPSFSRSGGEWQPGTWGDDDIIATVCFHHILTDTNQRIIEIYIYIYLYK